MTNPSEKEKTLDKILYLKEEIWETKAYISSDICVRCSEMYDKITKLEQELKQLEKTLEQDECN